MPQGLFEDFQPMQSLAANQYGMATKSIGKGSLISFEYLQSWAHTPNMIHDPRPMIIVTDIWAPQYIRGLNLHYLTFPYVKYILKQWSGNASFSYTAIQADKYLASAFRMYSLRGVKKPKRLDSEWLVTVLNSVRSFDAGEIERIRASIEQQIQARLQAKASELTAYDEWRKGLNRGQQLQFDTRVQGVQDALTGGLQRNLTVPQSNVPTVPMQPNAAPPTQPTQSNQQPLE